MMRWERTIAAGTLLEISFERARTDPPQALVLEVDRGRLAWDEQGEEGRSIRIWADRHDAAVLRLTGRFARSTLTVWHAWLDRDELQGEVVRRGDGMLVDERPASATLRCGEDLVARIGMRQRARTSSA
ncbi:MAG TPA: hypothetical protein VHF89_01325 [Solirubrobacteraceae bacterium]|nr:hypothetical protein [Solirubrobacteraceae bacterium]